MNDEKVKKNLYLPSWVAELLDKEGKTFGGPGQIASAAIHYFSKKSNTDKRAILLEFLENELTHSYDLAKDQTDRIAAKANPKRTKAKS